MLETQDFVITMMLALSVISGEADLRWFLKFPGITRFPRPPRMDFLDFAGFMKICLESGL